MIITPAQIMAMDISMTGSPWLVLAGGGAVAIVLTTIVGYAAASFVPRN